MPVVYRTVNQPTSIMANWKKYRPAFTDRAFWSKLGKYARAAGAKVVYAALLLYYAYRRKDTPAWAKRLILGALGYLIAPIDVIPDLSPIIGYTDDFGVLGFALVTVAAYVNDEVRNQARQKLTAWFPDAQDEDLDAVDERL